MSKKKTRYIAIDTECTGGDFHRRNDNTGIRSYPYYISTCDDEGNIVSWEFDVSPNRVVKVPKEFRNEFYRTVRGKQPVFHNSQFDLRALASIGVDVTGWLEDAYHGGLHDTLVASHVYRNTGSHRLKDLALEFLDMDVDDEDELLAIIKKARNIATRKNWSVVDREHSEKFDKAEHWLKMDGWIPRNLARIGFAREYPHWSTVLASYGDRDAERTMGLFLFYHKAFSPPLWKIYLEQLQVIPCAYDMTRLGMSLNLEQLKNEHTRYTKTKVELTKKIQDLAETSDLNPNSPKQLSQVLFQELGCKPAKMTKTGASLDKYALPAMLADESLLPISPRKNQRARGVLENLLEYRKVDTSLGYLDQYKEYHIDGRLHPGYNQTGTSTTRFSSSRPNIMQVGKGEKWEEEDGIHSDYKLRKVFGPEPGRIWFCLDYKQLQLGIFANIVGEEFLIEGFKKGFDAHDTVARRLFNVKANKKPTDIQRRSAKAVNFGYIFGKSEKNLDKIQPGLGAMVRKIFPSATRYLDDMKRRLYRQQQDEGVMTVTTRGGYPLEVPPGEQGDRPYAGVCYEVQGTEGVLVKRAMVNCRRYCQDVHFDLCKSTPGLPDAFMSFQVHDELGFDFLYPPGWCVSDYRTYIVDIKNIMEEAGRSVGVDTPVSVSVVETTWDSPKELDW